MYKPRHERKSMQASLFGLLIVRIYWQYTHAVGIMNTRTRQICALDIDYHFSFTSVRGLVDLTLNRKALVPDVQTYLWYSTK